tara:strand:+ start:639 stop:1166 length:528 start_codon:yes stop_codon:yes gene_type:complete
MIRGDQVFLKAIEEADLEKLLEWRNIAEFRKNFREFRELNMHQQHSWFKQITKSKSDFMFSIFDNKNSELIGACGLTYIDWIARNADFSFYIGKDRKYIDEVYATNATNLLLKYGFNELNLNKIWMELYEFDHAKIDFFTKNFGFEVDGKLRQNCYFDGEYFDSFIISLLKDDFA